MQDHAQSLPLAVILDVENLGGPKHVSASVLRAPSPRSRARGVGPVAGGAPERSRGAGGSGKGGRRSARGGPRPYLVLHLGDYTYRVRDRRDAAGGRPATRLEAETRDLHTYRLRHTLYKLDPDLQGVHARVPFLAVWEDHEVASDYSGIWPEYAPTSPEFIARRAAAHRAYCQHMPIQTGTSTLEATTRVGLSGPSGYGVVDPLERGWRMTRRRPGATRRRRARHDSSAGSEGRSPVRRISSCRAASGHATLRPVTIGRGMKPRWS